MKGKIVDKQIKWTDKKFDFDYPESRGAEFVERLRRSPDRMEELVRPLSHDVRIRRQGDQWSIQEHAGHLGDTEELFLARVEDFRAGVEILAPAEMSGKKTFAARHNDRDVEVVLSEFRTVREEYMAVLDALPPEAFGWSSLHPRLNTPMRLCDMLYFQSEHDAYHLTKIQQLMGVGPT